MGDPFPTPAIFGPATAERVGSPPAFDVDPSPNAFYGIELAIRRELFDSAAHTEERFPDAWYGSWEDSPFFSSSVYIAPVEVWERLNHADRVYYRLWTTSSATEWQDIGASFLDEEAALAPFVEIIDGTAQPAAVTFPSGATFAVVDAPRDGVDYSDPVTGGSVPLVEVAGRGDEFLSANFRVAEFAASDGARYARISPDLVDALQRLRDHIGAPVEVRSGYRHPVLNDEAGGADESQHMVGHAADIRSPGVAPLDLAQFALGAIGCVIGIGLGQNTIHIDMRGVLTSWAYDGAVFTEPEFDAWVRERCGG